MKKRLALLLALVMLLLTACGVAQPSNNHGEDTGSTKTTIDKTTDTGTAETTGDCSSTGTIPTTFVPTIEPTTESTTEQTIPTTENVPPSTMSPTESTVPGDYTLKVSQSTLSLEVGQIGNLTVEYTGTGTIVWKTSDSSIATVSNGKVTAKAAGTVYITVTDGVKSSQCFVSITQKEAPVDVTLKLSKSSMSLKVGETATLSVTYTGSKSLTWSSSNTTYATVSNGKLTAKAAGTIHITVTDGVKSATCMVTITNAAAPVVVNLSVSPTTLNLVVGNTSTLTADYNGTGTPSWSSDNTSVVTVSASGKVTAKAAGSAKVTVTAGGKKATCDVTVTAPVTNPTLKINTKNNTTISIGETLQIDYTYSGDKSKLTWTSVDTSVLTVNNNGVVTGKAAGSSLLKVTDGNTTCRIYINVEAAKPKATSLKESEHNAPLYDGVVKYAGDYMTFKVNVQPDASDANIVVTSSNTSVVSASWNLNYSNINVVTLNFKKAGSATVTITSADGAKSESYSITVKGDYACNPGSGQLTPEQFVNAYDSRTTNSGQFVRCDITSYIFLQSA